jgi:hypothetical protein
MFRPITFPYLFVVLHAIRHGLRFLRVVLVITGLLLAAGLFYKALRHRQIYSEDCQGHLSFSLRRFGRLQDRDLKESSGLAFFPPRSFLTHNDDTDPALYRVSPEGKTLQKWWVGRPNKDWEEICRGDSGLYYLGDIGNNSQSGRILKIHILEPARNRCRGTIWFTYPDYRRCSLLRPGSWDFDCEAMVWQNDSLYLFTKNSDERSTHVYALAARPGRQYPVFKQRLSILGVVTGAGLRPDGRELALLTYGKLYFFDTRRGLHAIPPARSCLAMWSLRQTESVSYWGRDSLLVGNEQRDLFLVTRK